MISEFAKEKVFWTRKMNLKLVRFMESRPNIWNPKHPKYTSLKLRDEAYAEFAAQYGNEFTGQAVKDRWTNIRSTFANYVRKIKTSRAKNNGQACKITWHLWDACKFLLKANKNLQLDSIEFNEGDKQGDSMAHEDSCDEDSERSSNFNDEDSTCENLANSILNVFRGVQNDSFGLDNSKYGRIGRLVATKLAEMNSYDAALTSNKIMDILWLYHSDNPLNPNNVKPELL